VETCTDRVLLSSFTLLHLSPSSLFLPMYPPPVYSLSALLDTSPRIQHGSFEAVYFAVFTPKSFQHNLASMNCPFQREPPCRWPVNSISTYLYWDAIEMLHFALSNLNTEQESTTCLLRHFVERSSDIHITWMNYQLQRSSPVHQPFYSLGATSVVSVHHTRFTC